MHDKTNEEGGNAKVRPMPSSEEVARAAHDWERTLKLVNEYKLTAVELSELLNRLPTKAVPW